MFKNWFKSTTTQNNSTPSAQQHKQLIELNDVVKVYETPAGSFTALKGIDLKVDKGEFVAVIGKSGSGKSTLINTITGIDRPTLGEVIVGGVPIHSLTEDEIAVWRGNNLGVIFQFFQLLPTLTLIENIMLPMEFCRLYSPSERKERALHLLEMVDMAEQADKLPSAVSGGQQQRVAIARALANDPAVLIADEPTGSLDSKTADAIFQLFEDLVAQGKTILMVTHDQDLASRVNRVVTITDGEIADEYISQALQMLDKQELVQLSSKLEPVRYNPGSVIFHKGDSADRFYIIVKGQVEVVLQHTSGKEMVGATISSGQYFGEIGLLQGGKRTATVRATAKSEVIVMGLERETFSNLITGSRLTNAAVAHLMRQRITAQHLMSIVPDVSDAQWQDVKSGFTMHTYQPGEVIVQKDAVADAFYIITAGTVEILQDDQTTVLAQLSSGQYFGEIGLLREGKRTATVRAAKNNSDNVELMAISGSAFTTLMTDAKMTQDEIILVGMRRRLSSKLSEFGIPSLQRRKRSSPLLDSLTFDDN